MIPQDYEQFTAKKRREFIAKLAAESVENNSPKFRVKRFYLTNDRNRSLQGQNSHEFGSVIKSFWVCNWSGNFTANFVGNHKYDRDFDSGLPLRKNMAQKFDVPVADACLEFTGQAGVWIDIAYSDSEDIQVGNVELSVSGKSSVDEGSTFTSQKMTATGAPTVLLAADGARKKAVLQHKSGGSVWIGSQADLNDVDYQNICVEWPAGSTVEWWNTGALYFKGTGVFSLMIFKD